MTWMFHLGSGPFVFSGVSNLVSERFSDFSGYYFLSFMFPEGHRRPMASCLLARQEDQKSLFFLHSELILSTEVLYGQKRHSLSTRVNIPEVRPGPVRCGTVSRYGFIRLRFRFIPYVSLRLSLY